MNTDTRNFAVGMVGRRFWPGLDLSSAARCPAASGYRRKRTSPTS